MQGYHHIARLASILCLGLPTLAVAQDPLALGTRAMVGHDFQTARRLLEEAVRVDPASYEANWRLAAVLLDIGKQVPEEKRDPVRDSLYVVAESYARRATAAKPDGADGHFILANAIGRTSLTKGKKERIQRAAEIRAEALRAIELDPKHDGAYHVLGRWHAEIQRLSPLERFFAKNFMGAAIFNEASWDEAERLLRLAVELRPQWIYHRLDLALILADRDKWSEAKVQLDVIAQLPPMEPMDATYKRQALTLAVRVAAHLKP
jgi:tetratricopeptide (TPR) repeat protein